MSLRRLTNVGWTPWHVVIAICMACVGIAATWDGETIRFYVNGVLESMKAHTFDPPVGIGGAIRIGNDGATNSSLNGRMDDLRLYSRVLTAAEIAALAAMG